MNLSDITTQPYILALFKRDDGQRFLLGSGAYEFKESQQHFVANAMVNDVVEVQGSDGALLAGQVRRASVQSFDGYIGDGGVIKSSVENYRKNFIAYFQKNHLYTVVYIFADGTAIQRKRGYIVDAPEVKELYQMTPEYHIAMNFEDVNYYKYAENSDGDEMYSNYVNVTSATASSGGLIWDTGGESSVTAEGTQFNIYGTIAGTALDSFALKGQTVQQTYTGKNLYEGSQDFSGVWSNSSSWDTDSSTYNGLTVKKKSIAWNGLYKEIEVEAGKTYTFSTFVKADSERPVNIYMSGGTATTSPAYSSTITATTEWQRVYLTFVVSVSGTIRARIESTTSIASNYTYICGYQLEESPSMTSYEPYTGGIASPNPDYPQTVQVVTGVQKITIGDGGENSDIFTANLGSIELCKIGTYQDYIYKSGDDWYVHKETKKLDVSALTGWYYNSNTNFRTTTGVSDIKFPSSSDMVGDILCSDYTALSGNAAATSTYDYGIALGGAGYVSIRNKNLTSLPELNTYLANNQVYAYVALATATDTQITDDFLITELDGLLQMAECYDGVTTFKNEAQAADSVPGWMVIEVTTGSGGIIWDNIGATWEEGGEGGDTYVTVDSITNVFPTITIQGPAYNPKITNVTTGQIIQYNGNVNGSQKLIIDIEQKTAKLSGTSVISNISGDWLYLTPGVNRLTYTIDNADKNYATIEWQEITG